MCASGRLVVCGRGHLELRDRGIGLCGARVWKLECRPAKGPGIPRVLRDTFGRGASKNHVCAVCRRLAMCGFAASRI